MAAFAASRYARKIGAVSGSGTGLCKFKTFGIERESNTVIHAPSLSSPAGRFDYRGFSQFMKSNGGRLFLVDTLALVILFTFYFCVLCIFGFPLKRFLEFKNC